MLYFGNNWLTHGCAIYAQVIFSQSLVQNVPSLKILSESVQKLFKLVFCLFWLKQLCWCLHTFTSGRCSNIYFSINRLKIISVNVSLKIWGSKLLKGEAHHSGLSWYLCACHLRLVNCLRRKNNQQNHNFILLSGHQITQCLSVINTIFVYQQSWRSIFVQLTGLIGVVVVWCYARSAPNQEVSGLIPPTFEHVIKL